MNHSIKWVIVVLLSTQMCLGFAADNISQIPSILNTLDPKESHTLSEIKQLRAQGKLQEAQAAAEQYLKTYPKDGDVLFLLGLIYQEQKNDIKAQELFATALQQTPTYTDVRVALIRLKIRQGAFGEANNLLTQGLSLTPQKGALVQLQAELQAKEIAQKKESAPSPVQAPSNLNTAAKTPEPQPSQAVRIPKPSSVAILNRLIALRKAGKLNEVLNTAKDYLQKNPDDYDVKLQVGLVYAQQKKYSAAKTQLEEVLQNTPKYVDARVGLIRIARIEKNEQEAERLLAKGLELSPKDKQLLTLKNQLLASSLSAKKEIERKKIDSQALFLKELHALRAQGRLEEAKKEALDYLTKHPKDYDVTLFLGLVYSQLKEYERAQQYLETVLSHVPRYVDARAGLIRISIAEKKYHQAELLLQEGFKLSPRDQQLLSLKKNLASIIAAENLAKQRAAEERLRQAMFKSAQMLLQAKKYRDAKIIVKELIKQQPLNSDYIILLANIYLEQHNDYYALYIIREALRAQPNNIQLLIKRGQIDNLVRAHSIAAQQFFKVLMLDPNNAVAKRGLADIESLSPHFFYGVNDIGLSTDNAYVDDLGAVWNYSSLTYLRELNIGRIGGKINYASRLGFEGRQYEINFSPRFNRNFYTELVAAYSKVPELFPNTLYGGEAFLAIPKTPFEISAGAKWAKIDRTFLRSYTGSLNFYPEGWWINFRPFYYFPKDSKSQSILYTARVRKYFNSVDHFIGVAAGVGRSPDLADLLNVNFIVIKNRFVNVNYTFGVFNYRVLVDLSAGYQRWQYPSDLVRRLYDGNIGFRYRF